MFDYFLTYDVKICYLSFVMSFIFDILPRLKRPFPNAIQCFRKSDVTSAIESYDVTFSVACELSQPTGKTEFSSTAKNITNSTSKVRNDFLSRLATRRYAKIENIRVACP